MRDEQNKRIHFGHRNQSTGRRWAVPAIGLILLFIIPSAPASVEAMGDFLEVCEADTRRDSCLNDKVRLNCPGAIMKKAPTFASNPPGFASYPFDERCQVERQAGQYQNGVIHFSFEGRWNPSETRQDRPNAVETLFIENYEQFFLNRQMKGPGERRIFLYWTARCTKDPWLQGGVCQRLGEYVPADVYAAFPTKISNLPFPLTGNSLSAKLKQQLIQQYREVNQPGSARLSPKQGVQNMVTQPQQPQIMPPSQRTQAMVVQPQQSPIITQSQVSALARSGIFARGVVEKEGAPSDQPDTDAQVASVETSDQAILEEGTPELAEPTTLQLERALYIVTAKPDAIVLNPGTYEVGVVMDLQLGLAKEGQPTVLLNAKRDTHSIHVHRTIAAVIPGPSDDLHLLFLTPDGRRFDAVGFESVVKPRSIDQVASLSDTAIEKAVAAAFTTSRSVSSPACQPNSAETGPRWIPVPCTMPAAAVSTPSP